MNSKKVSVTLYKLCLLIFFLFTPTENRKVWLHAKQVTPEYEVRRQFNERSTSDTGSPPEGESTGSRGDCIAKELPLVRLVGRRNSLDLTANRYPTFFVYVPYTSEEATSGVFSIQYNRGEQRLWKAEFQLPESERGGIVSITLPTTESPLEEGVSYRWYFELECPSSSSGDRVEPAFVDGWVRLASRSEVEEIVQQANSTEDILARAKIYAGADPILWYDALSELEKLLTGGSSAELEQEAIALLLEVWASSSGDESAILQEITQQPFLGNVRITPQPNGGQ